MDPSPWLARWSLVPDGPPWTSGQGWLLPVRSAGRPAVLKVTALTEEIRGYGLLRWWDGQGAVQVYAQDGGALLMERAGEAGGLAGMARGGEDRTATEVLCGVLGRLHTARPQPWPELCPLPEWFRALEEAAALGGAYASAWEVAQELLGAPREVRPLHGDLHHGNVLRSARGWLVIDPKGLLGDRAFDYANLLCNPDLALALEPGRLERRVAEVTRGSGLDARRLLAWTGAYAALSSAWHREDGQDEASAQTLVLSRRALALASV